MLETSYYPGFRRRTVPSCTPADQRPTSNARLSFRGILVIILPDDDRDPLISVSPSVEITDLLPHGRRRSSRSSGTFSFPLPTPFFLLLLLLLLPLPLLSFSTYSSLSLPISYLHCDRFNDYGTSRCREHTLERGEEERYDASLRERVALSKGWTNQLLYPTPRKALEAEAPNVHEQRSVIAYFERGKGKKS